MKMPLRLLSGLLILWGLVSCSQPLWLNDDDVIPVGSRVEFYIWHDHPAKPKKAGWRESNIHIASLQRPMTGEEARHWAEGVGVRDAGMAWTHYYVLVTPPKPEGRQIRSAMYPRPAVVVSSK
ncbi:MAG: hypothetical protein JNN17_13165 [Verrucomicrobiaceae bacterium]|nr:hypothetical protein [Verrucomicrobiaceae bacterium]